MKKIIPHVYLRVSTRDQFNHGGGWDEQDRLTNAYISDRYEVFDLDNIQYIHDEGVSAYSGSNVTNGNLGKFINEVEKGTIGRGHALVCYSIDRLSRQNTWVGAKLVSTLIEAGVEIHNVLEGTVLKKDDQIGAILSSIYLMRANNESEIKRERAIAGYKQRLAKSIKTGSVLTGQMPRWLYNDNGKYAISSEMKKIIDYVFEQYIDGVSTGYIAKNLNEKGWLYNKTEWRGVFVSRLIRDRRLLGEHIRYGKQEKGKPRNIIEVIPNFYPIAIDKEKFIVANNMIDVSGSNIRGRTRISYGDDNAQLKNIFSGLMVCGQCGGKVSVSKNCRDGEYFIRCRTRYEKKSCTQPDVKYKTLERAILEHIKNMNVSDLIYEKKDTGLDSLRSELLLLRNEKQELLELIKKREKDNLRVRPTTIQALEEVQDSIDDFERRIEVADIDGFEPSFDYEIESVMDICNVRDRGLIKKGLMAVVDKISYDKYEKYVFIDIKYYKDFTTHALLINNTTKNLISNVSIKKTDSTIFYESNSICIQHNMVTNECVINDKNNNQDLLLLLNVIDFVPNTEVVREFLRSII